MATRKLIYDSYCGWPYAEPYGMVPEPKKKRVYKKRERKKKKKGGYMSALMARPPKTFAKTFVSCAMRECEE